MAARYRTRATFTIASAVAGTYAAERVTFPDVLRTGVYDVDLIGVTCVNENTTPAGAIVELWLGKLGANPATDADWTYSGSSITGAGSATWPLASYPNVQIRAKSGGATGTCTVSVTAD